MEFKKLYEYYKSIEKKDIDYIFYKKERIKGLKNELSIKKNITVFESKDLYEIISLIIIGKNIK